VELASDIPPSAGLSSSAALTVALTWAVVDANDLARDPAWRAHVPTTLAFAEYAAAVETGAAFGPFPGDEGVGVRGGSEDHIAILCSRDGMLGRFSYVPAREEGWVPWPDDFAIAIGVSGVRASKTGNARAAYNRASDALSWLVAAWNARTGRTDPTLAAAFASGSGAARELAAIAGRADRAPMSGKYLASRLAQFREECVEIVPGVADAFRRGDLARVGTLVDRSQELAERALENQVPETVFLARAARERGALAASAFGAGFGGAVWAMVPADGAARWLAAWKRAYLGRFPTRATRARFLLTVPSGSARVEDSP
jgi:galactokinase